MMYGSHSSSREFIVHDKSLMVVKVRCHSHGHTFKLKSKVQHFGSVYVSGDCHTQKAAIAFRIAIWYF